MTRVYWFTQFEHGGFPIERAALGSCDLSMLTSTGNGNGWFGKQAATWRRVLRALQSMHNGKQKPLRWSSAEMAHLTRTDPTRNIDRLCRRHHADIVRRMDGCCAKMEDAARPGHCG